MPKTSGRWIPWYFVIFFVVLALILGQFCIVAFKGYSGTVTEDAYDKGLAYNKDLAASEQQKKLGWHGVLSLEPVKADGAVHGSFTLRDVKNAPVNDAKVKLIFVRPVQSGMDQKVDMKPEAGGRYSADITLPAHGLWEVHVSALAQGSNYQISKRFVVP